MKKLVSILVAIALIAGLVLVLSTVIQQTGDAPPGSASVSGGSIVINEVMTNNKGIYPDDEGNGSDWVELYNPTDEAVSLSRYTLSDDAEDPAKWAFPRYTLEAHSYIIVFLTGDSKSNASAGILHGSFKLSAEGETLLLSDSSGTKMDSVDIPAMPENISYGLVGGQWQPMGYITPGYENSESGRADYQASRTVQNPALAITEVMAKNGMTVFDARGETSDWVEIANISGEDFDLSGCGLTDDPDDPLKWRFPEAKLGAGETLLIFCSGQAAAYGSEGPLEANFRLSAYNMAVTLSDAQGRTMDHVASDKMSTDWSYARVYASGSPSDSWALTSLPTPGYPNTDEGFAAFLKNDPLTPGDIIISEVLCSNNKIDFAETGASSDYIEIENRGAQAVNIGGYGLTDNARNPAKYRFPDMTLQPGERAVVYATGAEDASGVQASFKMSRLGNTLALFNAQDQLIDRYFIGTVPQNISVGREEGATAISYFATPTPGQANGGGKAGIASAVQFSQVPGKYDGAIQLTLSASDGCDIYYTTDGSTPTEGSKKYTGPVTVSETTALRARAFAADYIPSATASATYFIGTQHTLPVVSITTEYANLFDPATGIYVNSKKDVEVPASFELFDESGQRVFQQDIGLAMTGGMTLQLREQKSFEMYARSQYGQSTMAYPFFENRNYTEYKSLILRSAARDDTKTKLSNYVALGLVDGQMNVMTQAGKPCVVYVDGEYWGLYFLMEKRNKFMVAQYEGITDESVIDSINLVKGLNTVNNGSSEGYREIYNYIHSHDMSLKENYDWVAARLHTDSYMDLMINEIYTANYDPGNMQFYQVPPDGLWIQIYQDIEIAFYSTGVDMIALRRRSDVAGSDIFNALLEYRPWRDKFIERFAWTLENIYNTERVTAVVNEAADLVRREVAADRARWSDLPSSEDFEAGVTRMLNFAKKRPAEIVNELKRHFTLTQTQIQMLEAAAGS